jgi:hypothetical protein
VLVAQEWDLSKAGGQFGLGEQPLTKRYNYVSITNGLVALITFLYVDIVSHSCPISKLYGILTATSSTALEPSIRWLGLPVSLMSVLKVSFLVPIGFTIL